MCLYNNHSRSLQFCHYLLTLTENIQAMLDVHLVDELFYWFLVWPQIHFDSTKCNIAFELCRYHSLYKPTPSPEVQARLCFNPLDSEAQLLKRVKEYWCNAVGLQAFYPQAVCINADQDPFTVFESLECRLVGRLPKVLPNREIY